MNNARYIEWICDLLPRERFISGQIAEMDIKYEKEVHCGTNVLLEHRFDEAEGAFYVKGGDAEGNVYFYAKGRFEPARTENNQKGETI